MALIKCPECGKEISDRAEVCIHCVFPIKNNIEEALTKNEEECVEESYFTICNKCGRFDFTTKSRIDNTTKSEGYPTCMWCGGEIKVLAGKKQWMKKSKVEREEIAQKETIRVKSNPEYDLNKAREYGTGLRADLDVQRYCPRCGKDYSKSKNQQGIMTCEFCGSEIESSNMLVADFSKLWQEEKEKLGIGIPETSEPIERLIVKTFLLDDARFNEGLFNKRWHPEQYKPEQKKVVEKNVPKCPTCQSSNIIKISGTKRWFSTGLFGLASSDVGKTMKCKNCGYKW